VFNPEMLLFGVRERPAEAIWMVISAIIGITAIAVGVEGWFITRARWYERIMAIVGGILLLIPGLATDIAGAIILAVFVAMQLIERKVLKAL
jgi:TRAP-type uncharacterized transport system fused permease subunit